MNIPHLLLAFTVAALAILPGCALRSSIERDGLRAADGLSADYPADADRLAREAAEELSRRYAPARTSLALLVAPGPLGQSGQFGQSLEQGLRAKGFAVSTDQNAPGVHIGSVADVIRDELTPSGYVEISTSDGQRFSLVRRLKGDSLPAPLVPTSGTVVEAPFTMPEPAPVVQATPLTDTLVPAAGPVPAESPREPERQVFTPENKNIPASARPTIVRTVLLPKAVLTVLPYNWRYTIPDTDRRQVKVSTPKNIPWREAIRTMAEESGCEARFDEPTRRVTLVASGPVPLAETPTVATSPAAPAQPVSALHPASLPESSPVAATLSSAPASPVVTAALQDAKEAVPPATPPVAPSVAVPSVAAQDPIAALVTPEPSVTTPVAATVAASAEPPALPEESWALESGSLYSQLGRWADQAGYQLVWKADKDLTMESSAVFKGTFMDAVRKLFSGLNKSGHGLRVTFYQSNNVMEVRGE